MSQEDRAQEYELMIWEANNALRPQIQIFKKGERGYGPEDCTSCGDEMPPLRREYGRKRCTFCQEKLEKSGHAAAATA